MVLGGINLSEISISVKVEKSLKDIGLTVYESQAYLALVRYGELTAGNISEKTSIPYSKVYSVLDNLERKGWIEIKGGRPRLYYPKSPVEALRAEQLRQQNRFENYKDIVVSELQPVYEQRDVKEKPEIWIIRGIENIASKINEIIDKVRRELMVAIPKIPSDLSNVIIPNLEFLRDTNVDILLLTTPDLMDQLKSYFAHIVELKVTDDLFGGGIIVDGQETLLFLGKAVSEDQTLAIWSDHVGLTMIAKIYFEHLWNSAKPYASQSIKIKTLDY